MIKYNLKCHNNHEFESWFLDSNEFEKLNKKKLLECIYCSSKKIEKSIMAPMISATKSKNENTMRITKKQLRKIIKEYKEMLRPGHVDGHPWSGTLEDLATVQSKTWGHGNIVDPKGYKEIVNSARDLTAGKAKSPLKKHGK